MATWTGGSQLTTKIVPLASQVTAVASATLYSLLAALNPTVVPLAATRRYLTIQAVSSGVYLNFGAAASANTFAMYTNQIRFDLLTDDISDLRVYAAAGGIVLNVIQSN